MMIRLGEASRFSVTEKVPLRLGQRCEESAEANTFWVDGDLLAARVRITGTHLGQVGSLAPIGKVCTSIGAYHCRLEAGKIIEDSDVWTVLPLYQQMLVRLQS